MLYESNVCCSTCGLKGVLSRWNTLYIFFLPKRKIICSARYRSIKIDKIWEIGVDWQKTRYSGVEMSPGQNSVMPKFGRGCAAGTSCKNCYFLSQLIHNLKLHTTFKNQPSRSIWRGNMRASSLFDHEKWSFLNSLCSKLRYKVEIWYADSVVVLNVSGEGRFAPTPKIHFFDSFFFSSKPIKNY